MANMNEVGYCWGASVGRAGPGQNWQLDQCSMAWGAGILWKTWTTVSGSSVAVCTSTEAINDDR